MGLDDGRATEHSEWIENGHGQHCLAPVAFLESTGVQTEPETAITNRPTTNTPVFVSLASYSTSSTQTSPLDTNSGTTTNRFVQMNPISTQISCHTSQLEIPPTLSTPTPATSSVSLMNIGIQTETTTYQNLEMGSRTCVANLQSPAPYRNGENSKIHSTSENSPNTTVFSSSMPSVTSSNSTASSTITTALETCQITAGFAQNHPKIEKLPIFAQNPPISLSPIVLEPTNNLTRAYASQTTQNEAVSSLTTHSASTSSPEIPNPPAVTIHPKNEQLQADFELQLSTESTVPTCTVTGLKTRSAPTYFMENGQKVENLSIFTQKTAEPLVSTPFNWADDTEAPQTIYTTPTKHPRDLSGLRSSSINPFSSLRRRHRNHRNPPRFINFRPQSCCHHTFRKPQIYSSSLPTPHCLSGSQPVLLNWDQDPRLADLSNALRALGWVRR